MSDSWLEGVPGRKRRRKTKEKKPPALEAPGLDELEDDEEDEQGLVCVAWLPIRCPHCHSKHQRNYKTRGRLRYHLCQDCRERFKSLELAPRDSPELAAE